MGVKEELEHSLVGRVDLPPIEPVTGVTPSRGDNCCCDPRVEQVTIEDGGEDEDEDSGDLDFGVEDKIGAGGTDDEGGGRVDCSNLAGRLCGPLSLPCIIRFIKSTAI